jgi:hypothetical protein
MDATATTSVSINGAAPGVAGGQLGPVREYEKLMRTPAAARSMQVSVGPSSIGQTGPGFEVADLFEYRIAQAVTIKKNQSAMLPFLQGKIKARKVVLFTDRDGLHPLYAAELTNSTGGTLDGGPITVFDGGGYAGEALVETVKAGDKRLISYGVDLGMRITSELNMGDRDEREIHVNKGVMTVRVATTRTTTYTINNVDAKAETLIIEHPLDAAFTVLNKKPSETTATARRFEVNLAPNAKEVFPVVEERVDSEEQMISSLTPDVILVYTHNKHLSDAGRRALEQVLDLKRKFAANEAQFELRAGQLRTAAADEERVRKNLESLNRVSGQQEAVQKYAAQLTQMETRIATLNDQQSETANKGAALKAELDGVIEKMTF